MCACVHFAVCSLLVIRAVVHRLAVCASALAGVGVLGSSQAVNVPSSGLSPTAMKTHVAAVFWRSRKAACRDLKGLAMVTLLPVFSILLGMCLLHVTESIWCFIFDDLLFSIRLRCAYLSVKDERGGPALCTFVARCTVWWDSRCPRHLLCQFRLLCRLSRPIFEQV